MAPTDDDITSDFAAMSSDGGVSGSVNHADIRQTHTAAGLTRRLRRTQTALVGSCIVIALLGAVVCTSGRRQAQVSTQLATQLDSLRSEVLFMQEKKDDSQAAAEEHALDQVRATMNKFAVNRSNSDINLLRQLTHNIQTEVSFLEKDVADIKVKVKSDKHKVNRKDGMCVFCSTCGGEWPHGNTYAWRQNPQDGPLKSFVVGGGPGAGSFRSGLFYFDVTARDSPIRLMGVEFKDHFCTKKPIVYFRRGQIGGHEANSSGWTKWPRKGVVAEARETIGLLLGFTEFSCGCLGNEGTSKNYGDLLTENDLMRVHVGKATCGTPFVPDNLVLGGRDHRAFRGTITFKEELTHGLKTYQAFGDKCHGDIVNVSSEDGPELCCA